MLRTATEILSREEEKLIQLSPVLESLQTELLKVILNRTFNIIMREAQRGWDGIVPELIPPPPEIFIRYRTRYRFSYPY